MNKLRLFLDILSNDFVKDQTDIVNSNVSYRNLSVQTFIRIISGPKSITEMSNPLSVNNEEEFDQPLEQSKAKTLKKVNSKRKLQINHKIHDLPRNSSFSSSSLATSYMKVNSLSQQENNPIKAVDYSSFGIPHFSEKYLPRGSPVDQLADEMQKVIQRKQNQIQTLRVYRDELKFISFNNPYYTPIKLSLKSLRSKAQIQTEIKEQKEQLQKDIKQADYESESITQYIEYLTLFLRDHHDAHEFIDMEKEQALMVENKRMQTAQIFKELEEDKRKSAKEIRAIQDEILNLRIHIKEKEDKLRDIKAKICTMYIKLHSRNSTRGKSQDRNISMSVRKFNTQNHTTIKEAFIGNSLFKNYSKQAIQKVNDSQELIKVRFLVRKDSLSFQCIYASSEGIIHSQDAQVGQNQDQNVQHRLCDDRETSIDIYIKYLFSLKFFFRSKVVGVECRVKTDKGTKNIQIGHCDPNIEHELLALVNRKVVTLGSYWHGKEMIGISVWYSDKLLATLERNKTRSSKNLETKKPRQTYEEYYT